MKRILLTLGLLSSTLVPALSQCIPDLSITVPGIYPDTLTNLPEGIAGVFYTTEIQVRVFTDTTVGPVTVNVVDITVDSVAGLPPGINYVCNPLSGAFPGGGNGCISLSGTCAVPGTYDLTVYVTLNGLVFGTFPASFQSVITGYVIDLAALPPPGAAFTQDQTSLCEDGVVQFTDMSTNSPTSWEWILPGGVPSSTTVQSPLVQYNTPGVYDVTLIATNAFGTDTLTQSALINVIAKPFAQVTPGIGHTIGFCPNDSIHLYANQGVNLSYEWYFYGNLVSTAQNFWATKAGTYKVKVTDNTTGCTKRSGLRYVEAYPRPFVFVFPPAANTICLGDSMLLETVNTAGYQYQWYRGPNAVNGATSYQFYATKSGYYRVELTNTFGCKKKSGKFDNPITVNCRIGQEQAITSGAVSVYPNPTAGDVHIDIDNPTAGTVIVAVYDLTGKLVEQLAPVELEAGSHSLTFDASGFESGIYFMKVTAEGWERTSKLIVEK
ncbi:MAG TPA: T9SS type A sorting domain-containing protein [Bacteroidia bacterium]|nr:T9SS type A sorting domain-containing protein [Bacteroidia bacterium]